MVGRTLYWGAAVLAGAGAWVVFPSVRARVVILVIAAVIVGDSLPNLNPRWGAPVTPQTQPALDAVVEDVAGRLGVNKPDRVWLTSFGPAVRLFPDGRRAMLRFHLAAVSCLARAQLEALVAHAFWSTVEDDADAAATTFARADEAAEAVVIGELAGLEYTAHQVDTRPPKPADVAIQDVDEGWPLFVAHGDAPTTMDDDHAGEARYHRTLADPILRVGEVRLRLADDRVVLNKIAEKEQRRLEPGWGSRSAPRLYTFADAPQRWWLARAHNDAEQVRGWAEAADDAALLDTLVRRADDRRLWLNLYAEYRLLAGGWRLEHPAVRGVLIDPAGERVDITRMDPQAVRELISPTLVA